jgi:hypothetical protein
MTDDGKKQEKALPFSKSYLNQRKMLVYNEGKCIMSEVFIYEWLYVVRVEDGLKM